MSVILQSCINCSNSFLSLEDLIRRSYVCDGNGNVYQNVIIFGQDDFCGLISDYTIVQRTFDGVEYDGILINHGLGKTTGLFLSVTDATSKTVTATAYIVDGDNIFLITDGLTDGGFCVR